MTRQVPPGVERATRAMFTRILAALARSLRDEELGVGQAAALHLIDHHGQTTVSALAAELALSMPTASRMVDELVRRGWATRAESAEDRRVRWVRLTDAGGDFVMRASEDRVVTILEAIPQFMPGWLVKAVMARLEKKFR